MKTRPMLIFLVACAFVGPVVPASARAEKSSLSSPATPERTSLALFVESSVFAPDPIQAPPSRQLEAGLVVSRGDGPFFRVRAGGVLRSLGTDLLGLLEGGLAGRLSSGIVGDVAVGVGARQQFSAGDLYVVNDTGQVERKPDGGTSLLLLTVQPGVGYDLRDLTGLPLKALVAPRMQLTLPQRDQAAVELGVGLRLQLEL
jgi:hypothetical protein